MAFLKTKIEVSWACVVLYPIVDIGDSTRGCWFSIFVLLMDRGFIGVVSKDDLGNSGELLV